MNLADVCIRKPVFAWMIMASVVLLGSIAFWRIGVSKFPDVDIPTVNIIIAWEGAAAAIVESDVVQPVEEAISQVEGITSISSSARQSSASISIEFDVDRSIDVAIQDVQSRLSQIQSILPKDITPPVVQKLNFEDFPIMWISLSGPFSRQVLADYTRYRLKERLQLVPGVGEVQWGGYLDRNVRLWFDPSRLDEHDLTVGEVIARLRAQHVELPAGRIETGTREMDVRVLGEALDLPALRVLVVGGPPNQPVRVGDVALVEDGFEDVRSLARNNRVPAQAVGVKKQRGTNAVAVAEGVTAAIAEINPTLPAGMAITVNYDQTRFIKQSVRHVEIELLLSVALTALVCWMFLGSFGVTFNVLLAIPMSLLGTVAVLHACDFTLNDFTLLGLALVVGIVVDDAIMVQENISRHSETGMPSREAASKGANEIAFAAFAASLAVVAVFLPVIFMPGLVGKFFLQFGVTLSVAVMLSYLEAMTLAPSRCAQFMRPGKPRRGVVGRAADGLFARLAAIYAGLLRRALARPWLTLLAAAAVFAASLMAIPALRFEIYPSQDQSSMFVRLETQAGSSLEETDRLVGRCEEWLAGRPEVDRTFCIIGGFGGTGVNTAAMFLSLVPPGQRALGQTELGEVIRAEFNRYPGIKAVVQDLSSGPGGRGFPIEFTLRGAEWDELVQANERMQRAMIDSGLMVDVDSDYQLGRPEVAVTPDRDRCQDAGVPVESIANALNALVGGVKVGKFSSGNRRIDMRARLLAAGRGAPDALNDYRVRAGDGRLIPLSELVTIDERPVLQAITRKDRSRAISVFANVAPGISQKEAMDRVAELGGTLPAGVYVANQGLSAQAGETMVAFAVAFVLGVLFAYMVLAAQFNSFLHPITVLTILPLALAGAIFGLLATDKSLNTFSIIGILLLMGIVKKNSIILVDFAQVARERGISEHQAMVDAGAVRLRPILMTSLATMAAAFPTALGLGAGSEVRQPMAIAIFAGVMLSTFLSLVVVPAFYVVGERGKRWLGMGRRDR